AAPKAPEGIAFSTRLSVDLGVLAEGARHRGDSLNTSPIRFQPTRLRRSVSVRSYGDPIAADPPGGRGGWGLGKPDRTVWPSARLSVAGTPTYDDGFPKAHPSLPPGERAVRVRTETLRAARRVAGRRLHSPAAMIRPPM